MSATGQPPSLTDEGHEARGRRDTGAQERVEASPVSPPVRTQNRAGAIILATGSPWPWELLLGRPLLAWAVDAFERSLSIGDIVLIVPVDRLKAARQLAAREGWRKVRGSTAKGRTEADLQAGLQTLDPLAAPPSADGLVVIHEGVRPLLTPALIEGALAALAAARGTTQVVVGATPVKETIKRVQGGLVVATLPRERLVGVQTPAALTRAHLRSLPNVGLPAVGRDGNLASALTAAALATGVPVATYPADPENLAVTSAVELAVAEELLRLRSTMEASPLGPQSSRGTT